MAETTERMLGQEASTRVSRAFLIALKLDERPAYRIAQEAGVHPTVLSRLCHGAQRVHRRDVRIVAVGKVLGLEAEACFG